ncbi:MAG: YraN family protein [Oligoflexales bacterium]|nr:YraN family protein [Oligoflexales bacterium]
METDIDLRSKSLCSFGENIVVTILEEQNWRILEKNFRCIGSEIDIIATKGETLAFVEVKTRLYKKKSRLIFEDLLTKRKRASLKRGAITYITKIIEEPQNHKTLRFDFAIVTLNMQKRITSVTYIPDTLLFD